MVSQVKSFARSGVTEEGIAAHMRQVFNYMTGGVALSGLAAWVAISNPSVMQTVMSAQWLFLIVWFGYGFVMGPIVNRVSPAVGLGIFAGFSIMTGLFLSPLALIYTGGSIAVAFFTAAIMFAGAAVYGYTSNKSLSGWGNFLMMGAWGLIGAVVVNLAVSFFTGAPIEGLSFVISLVAVPLFAGMTAWETNMMKEQYAAYAGDEVLRSRVAIMSANSLYMNFVVMFIHLLQLLGNRE